MDCMQYQKYSLREATDENSKKTQEWIAVSMKMNASHFFICKTQATSFFPARAWSKPVRLSTVPAVKSYCSRNGDAIGSGAATVGQKYAGSPNSCDGVPTLVLNSVVSNPASVIIDSFLHSRAEGTQAGAASVCLTGGPSAIQCAIIVTEKRLYNKQGEDCSRQMHGGNSIYKYS